MDIFFSYTADIFYFLKLRTSFFIKCRHLFVLYCEHLVILFFFLYRAPIVRLYLPLFLFFTFFFCFCIIQTHTAFVLSFSTNVFHASTAHAHIFPPPHADCSILLSVLYTMDTYSFFSPPSTQLSFDHTRNTLISHTRILSHSHLHTHTHTHISYTQTPHTHVPLVSDI